MTEQRNYRRINFRTEADVTLKDSIHRCDLVDLALQGALFRSERELSLPLGSQVPLSIYLPETSIRMEFVGELIHRNEQFYGFIFISEEAESMAHLRRLLELNLGDAELTEKEFSTWIKQGFSY
jgi:hypothetical protein